MLISRVVGVKNVLLAASDVLPSTCIVISTYFMIRGTLQLCEDQHHEKSLDPFLVRYSATCCFFAIESFQLSNLFGNHISIAEMQAYLNLFTIICTTTQNHLNWCNLVLNQQVSFRTAMCFAYHKLITMENKSLFSARVILDMLYKWFTESMQRSFHFNLFVQMWKSTFKNVIKLLCFGCDLIIVHPLFFGMLVILIVLFLLLYSIFI